MSGQSPKAASRIRLQTPLNHETVMSLRAGDAVLLSGIIYTARDAAHQRLASMLDSGVELPFALEGAIIYYSGPTPPPPGRVIGAAGPTTSYRMDSFTPSLYEKGLKGTIGKGPRGEEVCLALRRCAGIYFGATGGAGALLSAKVKASRPLAFPDLGPEAIYELTVEDFPLMVINDAHGGDLFNHSNPLLFPELA